MVSSGFQKFVICVILTALKESIRGQHIQVLFYVNLSVIRNYTYRNGCVATRKFQTVIQLVEKKWRLSGQKVILLVMRISANVQYDTKIIQLSWRPTYES
jgi:hypothetical protein